MGSETSLNMDLNQTKIIKKIVKLKTEAENLDSTLNLTNIVIFFCFIFKNKVLIVDETSASHGCYFQLIWRTKM